MRLSRTSITFIFVCLLTTVGFADTAFRSSTPAVWIDRDTAPIDEPSQRKIGRYQAALKPVIVEQVNQTFDVPRWVRVVARKPKQAANVNLLDEVPDSTWYTNRHHVQRMPIDVLVRGPNRRERPNFDGAVITRAKTGGVTAGLEIRDRRGHTYVIKFDAADFPELQSGAEVVSTKILHAAGYNVPENYIAYVRPEHLSIAPDVWIQDSETLRQRQFTRADLNKILLTAARRPNGTYRVLASKFLPGKPKGPFPLVGTRKDDPNDRIPHEHRRELRALRVIASWINHWDMREENSLDVYVENNGRRFLRHYLIDFGSTLGGGLHPLKYSHGRESAFDVHRIFKEIASLGFYVSASEKKGHFVSPAMAIFSNHDFDPGGWQPILPVIPFENMTGRDALWAIRIILSFKEEELRRIIETAEYTNPGDAQYLLKTLLERRQIISRFWLSKVNPIADFRLKRRNDRLLLTFKNLMPDKTGTSYKYQIKSSTETSRTYEISEPLIALRPDFLIGDEEQSEPSLIEVTIWTQRGNALSHPVRVYMDPHEDTLQIARIVR
jgi:hypothetical protein